MGTETVAGANRPAQPVVALLSLREPVSSPRRHWRKCLWNDRSPHSRHAARRLRPRGKSVKSAPPEAYLAGAGVLVGGAAVLLLTTTKSGRELLIRTAQLTLNPEVEEPESESSESDVQEEVPGGRLRRPPLRRNQQRTPTVRTSPRSQT